MTINNIFRKLTLVAVLALMFGSFGTACTTSYNPQEDAVVLNVGETVAHTVKQQFVSISTESAWTIEVDYLSPEGEEGWCSFNRTSGVGHDNVIMSFGQNTLEESRSLTLRVKFPSKNIEILFTQLAGGEQPTPDPKPEVDNRVVPTWLELPTFTADYEEMYFSKHMLPSTKNRERSFSVLYDSKNYTPLWIAYPLCKGNIGGSGNRVDDWGIFDPNIPQEKQLYMKSSYNGSYDRGHMLPSASRLGSNDDNRQTFYPTNMTPQLDKLNQNKWRLIEEQVRGWAARGCDTLYVVTGAVFKTVGGSETVNYTYCKSDSNKRVAIPNYYYKALLQRRGTGNNSSYQAIAIWVPHKAANGNATLDDMITIDQLEERTGIDFFPNLDDSTEQKVESAIAANYWGM